MTPGAVPAASSAMHSRTASAHCMVSVMVHKVDAFTQIEKTAWDRQHWLQPGGHLLTEERAAVHFRPAQTSDIPGLVRIFRTARAARMPWLPVLHSAEADQRFFENRVLGVETIEIVERDRVLKGFASHHGDWINHLYIAPDAWRQGLGSLLLQRVLCSVNFVQLWVFEQNTDAQDFYRHHGFEVSERTEGANNEEKCPDIRMIWTR